MAQPLPRTLQPPPELPNDPKTSDVLSQYLRTFSLWARHGFADKLSTSTAAPGLMLQAYDAPSGTAPLTFVLRVNSAGTLSATPIMIGGANPALGRTSVQTPSARRSYHHRRQFQLRSGLYRRRDAQQRRAQWRRSAVRYD